jgi:hypothetical protein
VQIRLGTLPPIEVPPSTVAHHSRQSSKIVHLRRRKLEHLTHADHLHPGLHTAIVADRPSADTPVVG